MLGRLVVAIVVDVKLVQASSEMQGSPGATSIDGDAAFAVALDALSNPVRLAIARALKEPRCLSEIVVVASDGLQPGARVRGSILARQTIKQHLNRLLLAGIVVARKASRPKGQTTEYVLNPHSLAAISSSFQQLARSSAKPLPVPLLQMIRATP